MAEVILKDLAKKQGIADHFLVASSATSTEEIWNGIGNPVYPPAKAELERHGLSCGSKRAVQLQKNDYDKYDLFIGMDSANIRNMLRVFGGDPAGKVHNTMDVSSRDAVKIMLMWVNLRLIADHFCNIEELYENRITMIPYFCTLPDDLAIDIMSQM